MKKLVPSLLISLFLLILAIKLKSVAWGFGFIISVFMDVKYFFDISGDSEKTYNMAAVKLVILAIILLTVFFADMSPKKSKKEDDGGSKKGFYGSDGKYHEYIPEFGDDVNEWMEENW